MLLGSGHFSGRLRPNDRLVLGCQVEFHNLIKGEVVPLLTFSSPLGAVRWKENSPKPKLPPVDRVDLTLHDPKGTKRSTELVLRVVHRHQNGRRRGGVLSQLVP